MSFQFLTTAQRLALLDSAAALSQEGRKNLHLGHEYFLSAQVAQAGSKQNHICTFAAKAIQLATKHTAFADILLRMSNDLMERASSSDYL
jgi:hypothetical protein